MTNLVSAVLLLFLFATPAPGQEALEPPPTPRCVVIGEQVWTTRNLDTKHYRNGDPIAHAETREDLLELGGRGVGAWMYVGGTPFTEGDFGLFYNWYALTDPRGLAPEGWHVPSDEEWEELAGVLGPDSAGVNMKSGAGWTGGGGGTGASTFNARPAGFRGWDDTEEHGRYGSWWTTTELEDDYYAMFRGVGADYHHLHRGWSTKYWGFSVRLVAPLSQFGTVGPNCSA